MCVCVLTSAVQSGWVYKQTVRSGPSTLLIYRIGKIFTGYKIGKYQTVRFSSFSSRFKLRITSSNGETNVHDFIRTTWTNNYSEYDVILNSDNNVQCTLYINCRRTRPGLGLDFTPRPAGDRCVQFSFDRII